MSTLLRFRPAVSRLHLQLQSAAIQHRSQQCAMSVAPPPLAVHQRTSVPMSTAAGKAYPSTSTPSTATSDKPSPSPTWQQLKVSSLLYNYLTDSVNLHTPSPIQHSAIPHLMRRPFDAPSYPDVLVQDITGHGKTLAYVLPILSNVDRYMNSLQAIVVLPSRELATQVNRVVSELCDRALNSGSKFRHDSARQIRCKLVVGSCNPTMLSSLHQWPYQLASAEDEVDEGDNEEVLQPHILIGTADTLNELLLHHNACDTYKSLKYIVVDEVDAVLNSEVGRENIEPLLRLKDETFPLDNARNSKQSAAAASKRLAASDDPNAGHQPDHGRAQVVLVSATLTPNVRELSDRMLSHERIVVTPNNTHAQHSTNAMPTPICHYYMVTHNKEQAIAALSTWSRAHFNQYQREQQNIVGVDTKPKLRQKLANQLGEPSVLRGGAAALLTTAHAALNTAHHQLTAVFLQHRRELPKLSSMLSERGQAVAVLTEKSSRSERRDATKLGAADVLLTTDLYARGMDLKTLTHIINAELPSTASQYLHRAGRVGRMGMVHTDCAFVITLVDFDDKGYQVQRLQRYMTNLGAKPAEQLIVSQGQLCVEVTLKDDASKTTLKPVRLAPKAKPAQATATTAANSRQQPLSKNTPAPRSVKMQTTVPRVQRRVRA